MKIFFICIFSIFICLPRPVTGQTPDDAAQLDTVINNIYGQFLIFPQEKLYIQTDKPYYINGEKIFFRAFLLDAFINQPNGLSRYIYVELINPLDSVVIRQQIRPEETVFHSALTLPEDLPQGNYRLRAYTRYMENIGEAYFYSRSIFIADPNAVKMALETEFEYENGKQVNMRLRFVDAETKKPLTPDHIPLRLNAEKTIEPEPDEEGWVHATFNLPDDFTKRTLFVEYGKTKKLFGQYLRIPFPEDKVDVTFYPEGGGIIPKKLNKIAFKALRSDGDAAEITGKVYNSQDEFIVDFTTQHDGMGLINLIPDEGQHYYAVCLYQDQSFRVDLPESGQNTFALQTLWRQNRLMITINKPDNVPPQKLYLFIHNCGLITYSKEWDFSREFIQIDMNNFYSGISRLLLLTEDFQPLSERLVFVYKDDLTGADILTEKKSYKKRELVKMDIQLKDASIDTPSGDFSISVTDDKDVQIDTTSNILSEILLVSELNGYVHNPAYYFQKSDKKAEAAADLLMMTQGWTRYDLPEAMRGNFRHPTIAPEASQTFSGMVKNVLFASKANVGAAVTILSLNNGFFDMETTDEEGRFTFKDFEFPDSTRYLIQALTKSKGTRVELFLDERTFPGIGASWNYSLESLVNNRSFADYVSKADLKYTYENGMRLINLPEVTVSAPKKPKEKNSYGTNPDYSITEDQLSKFPVHSFRALLLQLPGVSVIGDKVTISRNGGSPLFIMDGMRLMDSEEALSIIDVDAIAQVDLIKDGAKLVIYGKDGNNGVIEVMTKSGGVPDKLKFNIKYVTPLGYRSPVEFYSPRYDKQENSNIFTPDLRSTIYWKPSVSTDAEGKASLDFYTADGNSTYSVVMEGFGPDGQLIYSRKRAVITVE